MAGNRFSQAYSAGAELAGSPLSAIQAIGGAWSKVTSELSAGIAKIQGQVGAFVGAYNPAVLGRFNLAVKDLYGTIGEQLVPVMTGFTGIVRYLGDTIASLTPVVRPVIETVIQAATPIFQAMGGAIRQVVTSAGPFLTQFGEVAVKFLTAITPLYEEYYGVLGEVGSLIATVLTAGLEAVEPLLPVVGVAMQFLADGLRGVAGWVRELTQYLRDLLGIAAPEALKGDSRGKGAVGASTTDVQGMLRKLNEAAFGAGLGGQKPENKIAGAAEGLRKEVEDLKNYFAGQFAGDVTRGIKNAIPNVAGGAVAAVNPLGGMAVREIMRRVVGQ